MKKIFYLIVAGITLISCQKEEIISTSNNHIVKNNNVTHTWGYFIPSNAQKDTSIWIDSFEIQTWTEAYYDGVKYHEELIKIDKRGIDTLYVIKTEAYTGSDNHREDIISIKSTVQKLDLDHIKEGIHNIVVFDTLKQTLIFEYQLTNNYKQYNVYTKAP